MAITKRRTAHFVLFSFLLLSICLFMSRQGDSKIEPVFEYKGLTLILGKHILNME